MPITSPHADIEHVRQSLLGHPRCELQASNRASVALILQSTPADTNLLVIRRASREGDPWSGQMGLPGGHRHERDASDLETARRETWEEIGVDLTAGELLGRLDDVRAAASGRTIDLVISAFVYRVGAPPDLVLSSEVAAAYWVSIDDLAGGRLQTTREFLLDGHKKLLPGWNIEGHVLWGLTHRIVKNLLAHFPR